MISKASKLDYDFKKYKKAIAITKYVCAFFLTRSFTSHYFFYTFLHKSLLVLLTQRNERSWDM